MKNILLPFLIFFILVTVTIAAEPTNEPKNVSKNKSLLPEKILAGFLDIRTPSSTTRVDINKVKSDGYNVMIVAFGEVYNTNIGFYTSDRSSEISTQTAIEKIRQAKNLGMKVLLAVGGIPNTFHPGTKEGNADPSILGKGMTNEQIDLLATNIVNFLKKYDMNGIVYSFRKYTSPTFIDKLSTKIKEINPDLVIAAEPEVNDFHLVTTGRSKDFDKAIQNGSIDYLFVQEYNVFPQYDPSFISESYQRIIENSKIPLKTKILIGEPTNATAGGTNAIYHPRGDATKSLTTEEAVSLILPQLEKIKFKPRFAGVVGWNLNTDYAADLYGDTKHKPGSFAESLRKCIYDKICSLESKKIDGPVVAGFLPLWGKNSSYDISGQQVNSKPIDITMPKDKEYCDKNSNVCKYNVIIAEYLTYTHSKGFSLSFDGENGSSEKVYSPEQVKKFVRYMKSKRKYVLASVGGKFSHINWQRVDLAGLIKVVDEYGFDGINFELEGSDIPQSKDSAIEAANKIKKVIKQLREKHPNFWLTFSPEWQYVVPPAYKKSDSLYKNANYKLLIDKIGIDNINYIWLDTASHKLLDGVFGFYKDEQGKYIKITPIDGYAKFLASLAWAITTQKGYDKNTSRYKIDKPLNLPANKLVFVIPAVEGAVSGGMTYVISDKGIKDLLALTRENKASFGGFAVWSIDFDAIKVKKDQLSKGYSHKPWSTTEAIANIKLPPIESEVIAVKENKLARKKSSVRKKIIDTGVTEYPNGIGSYDGKTIVSYQGKKYRCISELEAGLCNDKAYMPNGLYGDLAWQEFSGNNKTIKKRVLIPKDGLRYPEGIGNYKAGTVIIAADRKFECLPNRELLCNDLSYAPIDKKGYQAWTDITDDTSHLDNKVDKKIQKPKGAEYIYPNGIESYSGGTTVAVGQDIYRCKVGPESSLCPIEAYKPGGKYGSDAWIKIE